MESTPEKRVQELHLTLPDAPKAVAVYKTAVLVGNMLYVSGHGGPKSDKPVTGRVGDNLKTEDGKAYAKSVGLNILATVKATLGSLDKVKRLVKTLGMVNCAPGFNRTPQVIDGCSDLLIEVFGDTGRGARSAVGMAELPFDISVEIELIVETTD